MPPDSFLAIQKVANGWVALPDGANDVTSVVQVFTTPDDLAGFVMGWALTSMAARPGADAPPPGRRCDGSEGHWPSPPEARPVADAPAAPPPAVELPPPPVQPQFVTDQPAVAQTAQPVLPPQQ